MKTALLPVFALLFASSCGPTALGQKCTSNADCSDTYSCFLQVAGGFCSKGCSTEGKSEECPAKSACAPVANATQVCVPECTDDSQCNTALRCLAVMGSTQKYCRTP